LAKILANKLSNSQQNLGAEVGRALSDPFGEIVIVWTGSTLSHWFYYMQKHQQRCNSDAFVAISGTVVFLPVRENKTAAFSSRPYIEEIFYRKVGTAAANARFKNIRIACFKVRIGFTPDKHFCARV